MSEQTLPENEYGPKQGAEQRRDLQTDMARDFERSSTSRQVESAADMAKRHAAEAAANSAAIAEAAQDEQEGSLLEELAALGKHAPHTANFLRNLIEKHGRFLS